MSIKIYIINSLFYENSNVEMYNGEFLSTNQVFIPTVNFSELSLLSEKIKKIFTSLENVEIHLIDKNNRIKYYYTEEGREQYEIFLNNISENIYIHSCDWEDYNKTIVYSSEDEYIFATVNSYRNKYEFALNIDGLFDINRFYIHDMKKLSDIYNIKKCASPLNLFLNENNYNERFTSRNDLQEIDEEAIKWLLSNGIEHCKYCIIAGFLDNERFVQNKIPSWVLNVETFYMKGTIYHNELFPKILFFSEEDTSHGKTIQEKFLESAKYRYDITRKMIEYLYYYCNYKNNDFVINNFDEFKNLNIYDYMLEIIKE